jgi:hypothetical protein
MMEAICSSETSVLTKSTRLHISEYGNVHNHRSEKLRSYVALTDCAMQRRSNVFPVKYELGFYIPKDDILHSHRSEELRSYVALTGCAMQRRSNVSPVKYELRFYIPKDDILQSHRRENSKSYVITTCP